MTRKRRTSPAPTASDVEAALDAAENAGPATPEELGALGAVADQLGDQHGDLEPDPLGDMVVHSETPGPEIVEPFFPDGDEPPAGQAPPAETAQPSLQDDDGKPINPGIPEIEAALGPYLADREHHAERTKALIASKGKLIAMMRKHKRTIYSRGGTTVTLTDKTAVKVEQ